MTYLPVPYKIKVYGNRLPYCTGDSMDNNKATIYIFCCATSYDQAEITRAIDRQNIETKVILIP